MRQPSSRASGRVLVLGALALAASACHKSRGSSSQGPGATTLEVDFALRTDLVLGSAFLGDVAHGDLDGDGLTDLVEANFGTRFVTVAFGRANGRFVTLHELPTLGHAFQLALDDLDGDGLIDIAVSEGEWLDGAPQAVQVFLQGPAPREFGPALDFVLSGAPKGLVSIPADGLVGSAAPGELFVALRDGERIQRLVVAGGALVANGELDSAPVGLGAPYSLAALDLGGDGFVDLVVGEDNEGFDRLLEFRRDAGGFQDARVLLDGLAKPIVKATGDMDSNGFEDLAIAQLESSEVRLLPGTAAGLAAGVTLDFGGETTSLLFEDLDGDGLAEAMGTVFLQESLQVRRGLAPFVWDAPTHYNVGLGPRALGVVTLPGDGHKDLLCANAQDLSLLLGRGDATFRGATGVPTGGERPILVKSADLDNDGDQDAVAITRFQGALVFFENTGGVLVNALVLDLTPSSKEDSYLALADVDADGDVDVVVAAYEADELQVFRNQGGPAQFAAPGAGDVVALGNGPFGIDLGDFDDDGRTDLLVGLADQHALQVLLGQADGSLAPLAPVDLAFEPINLLCADLDGDGHVDAVVTGRAGDQSLLALFAGDGAGGFALAASHELDERPAGLAMADLDEDGALDLVVGFFATATERVELLLNRGGLAFVSQPLDLAQGPGTPLALDADEDGHIDLVVPTTGGELVLARGNGAGGFVNLLRTPGELPCPDGTLSAAAADLDGDGLPELLMATPEAPFVWIAHNTSVEAALE
jgi:hypothetical protein